MFKRIITADQAKKAKANNDYPDFKKKAPTKKPDVKKKKTK